MYAPVADSSNYTKQLSHMSDIQPTYRNCINDEVATNIVVAGAKRLDRPLQSNILPAKKTSKDMAYEEEEAMDVSDKEAVDSTEESNGPSTKSTSMPPPVVSMAKRLEMMADPNAPNDKPLGVANIFMCAGLVAPLLSNGAAQELETTTGLSLKEYPCLMNPCRQTIVLLSEQANNILDKTKKGKEAKPYWTRMNSKLMPLEGGVEEQVNGLVRPVLQIQHDLFKPESIVSPDQVAHAVLLAMERIKVSHSEVLDLMPGKFKKSKNVEKDAMYAYDQKRLMPYMKIEAHDGQGACSIVQLVSKPDENGSRSLYFVLPDEVDEESSTLESCIRAVARRVENDNGMCITDKREMNFKFPCFDATHDVESIVPLMKSMGAPSMFCQNSLSFEDSLPTDLLETEPAFVGSMLHFASFSADHKGAEAKAVTVAAVCSYRSLPPPPIPFHCDRPFIVILADGTGQSFNPEFVLKVTGECLTTDVEP